MAGDLQQSRINSCGMRRLRLLKAFPPNFCRDGRKRLLNQRTDKVGIDLGGSDQQRLLPGIDKMQSEVRHGADPTLAQPCDRGRGQSEFVEMLEHETFISLFTARFVAEFVRIQFAAPTEFSRIQLRADRQVAVVFVAR